ncbi:hypothetical protein BC938DRAFT_471291 [Jimgerdemannia flammicorona]|uniref:Coilin n=1 Tax=Jimgerdemannia flammicorona TaxID=994334 RepID=A0A433Q8E6_9FUNG|nr:hypothetical protein BC938DRAFT_471291 [Jimgerdemannia flammicorona]
MRIRLTFKPPLAPYKCWYEIPRKLKIGDLANRIAIDFALQSDSLKLELDGFELYRHGTTNGLLKEDDIVCVEPRKALKVSKGGKNDKEECKSRKRKASPSRSPSSSADDDRPAKPHVTPSSKKKAKISTALSPSPGKITDKKTVGSKEPRKEETKLKPSKKAPAPVMKDKTQKRAPKEDPKKEETKKAVMPKKSKDDVKATVPGPTKKPTAPASSSNIESASESESESSSSSSTSSISSDNSSDSDSDSDSNSDSDSDSDSDIEDKDDGPEEVKNVRSSEAKAGQLPQSNGPAPTALASTAPTASNSASAKPVPFGQGKLATKQRNLRKQLRKKALRMAAGGDGGDGGDGEVGAYGAATSGGMIKTVDGEEQKEEQQAVPTHNTPARKSVLTHPSLSLRKNNKKKGFLKEMLTKESLHIRFDGPKGDPTPEDKAIEEAAEYQEDVGATSTYQSPARAIITSVELERPAGAKQSHDGKQQQLGTQYLVQRGPRVVVAHGKWNEKTSEDTWQYDGGGDDEDFDTMVTAYEKRRLYPNRGKKNKGKQENGRGKKTSREEAHNVPSPDYGKMDAFQGKPAAGDVIAYR